MALPLSIVLLSLTSCFNDSNNDDSTSTLSSEWVATAVAVGDYPVFRTDDGYILSCTNKISTDTGVVFTSGVRYYLAYDVTDTTGVSSSKTYQVKLNSYAKMSVKDYVTVEAGATDPYTEYEQDLFDVSGFLLTGNYLNTFFRTYAPLTSDNSYELIRLKGEETNTGATIPTAKFELRYQSKTLSSYVHSNFVSFNMSQLITDFPAADTVKLSVIWNDRSVGTGLYETNYGFPYSGPYSGAPKKREASLFVARSADGKVFSIVR